ncbi:acylneuraminate cytidylyltransferase [Actinocorallia sp. A-T 12471]|uniref:acylneuraminate cytidylyltransferase n=1 Tax=Actinocorallia sp. A-T 12471 TaxID=3089813 RepID=UPI0029CB8803|nr:acylneuraminate cytidylyltransferase [Actinocorallia sp. A-T 12471]MDX6744643.1 acylneuraminate cytidylyltransferase [Actinocorallia sp. A-T 12471]
MRTHSGPHDPAGPDGRAVCVIPARGGSKGLPGKNLAKVGGVPLIVRTVRAARAAQTVGAVLVSTDDRAIAEAARAAGARVVDRPDELSGDTASSESAVLHAIATLPAPPEATVLLQCTSPFLDPADLDAAITRVLDGTADTVFAALACHEFQWAEGPDGLAGVGHSAAFRPRRQDRAAHYRETGAFYVMRTTGLLEHGHRFFGRIAAQPVPRAHAVEIDSVEDLAVARALAPLSGITEPLDVDAVVTDFDGVHTDDRAGVGQDGGETVTVSREDGMGVSLLRKAGVPLLILSTETNPVVAARAAKLRVPVLHGIADKAAALDRWLRDEGLDPARVAYVGNDVNDLGCLALVGWPVAVPDAHPDVIAAARLVLTRPGGAGAVREICDLVVAQRTNRASHTKTSQSED